MLASLLWWSSGYDARDKKGTAGSNPARSTRKNQDREIVMAHIYLTSGDRIEVKETEQEIDDMVFEYDSWGSPLSPPHFIKLVSTSITRADQKPDCCRVNVHNIVYYR